MMYHNRINCTKKLQKWR